MRIRFAAHHVAMIATFLVLLPGHIGAGEAYDFAFRKIRVAVLAAPAFEQKDSSPAGKWRAVRERMRYEQRLVAACRNDPAACSSDAATQFMAIVDAARSREGRARVGEINRAINLSVRPASDEKTYGMDLWTPPLATLSSGQGDCEDYAIAKLAALWAAGIAEGETRLLIVRDTRAGEDHALAMVRLDGRWLALDNRRFTLIEAAHLPYRPLFAIGGDTVRAFTAQGSWAELDEDGEATARRQTGASAAAAMPVLL